MARFPLLLAGLCLALLAPAARAADWYVSPLGSDTTGDGSAANPWRSITQAMSVASSGDRILVAAGTYDSFTGESFPIVLADGVQVLGPEDGTATVDGENVFVPLFVVLDNLETTVLQNLRIIGSQNLVDCFGNPLDLRVQDCVLQGGIRAINHATSGGPASLLVERCTILDIQENAIHWEAVADPGEDHAVVVRDCTLSGTDTSSHGVFLVTAQDADVDLILENNLISKFDLGIAVQMTASNSSTHVGGLLSGNEVRKCFTNGFDLVAASSGTVASSASFDPEIRYNLFTKNDKHGFRASLSATGAGNTASFQSMFHGNTVTENQASGLFLSEQELIGGLCTTQPDLGGGATGSPGANTFALNDDGYASGAEFDLRIEAGEDISARQNWWGTAFPGAIDRHILDQKDDPLSGLVDVGVLASDPLQFRSASSTVAGEPGATARLTAFPGTLFVPRGGTTLLQILVDGIPATVFEVSGDGRELSFKMPVLPVPRSFSVPVTVTNPGGQGGTSSLHLVGDSQGGGFCFVATATYGDPDAPELHILRTWRDKHLLPTSTGRALVRFYYAVSPPVAQAIEDHPWLRIPSRILLAPVVLAVDLWMHARWVYAVAALLALRRLWLRRRLKKRNLPALP